MTSCKVIFPNVATPKKTVFQVEIEIDGAHREETVRELRRAQLEYGTNLKWMNHLADIIEKG